MKKFKFDWGHGVILGLGGFIIFILTLIYTADVSGDLVNDDYYETSLHYQEDNIDARNRAARLEIKPTIHKQANGYKIQFPPKISPDSGRIYLLRGAFKKDDVLIPLRLNGRNQALIPAAKLKAGEYDMSLTWYAKGEPYLLEETIVWSTP